MTDDNDRRTVGGRRVGDVLISELLDTVRKLSVSLTQHGTKLDGVIKAAKLVDDRSKAARVRSVVATFAGALAVVLACYVGWQAHEIVRTRNVNRISACKQENVFRDNVRDATIQGAAKSILKFTPHDDPVRVRDADEFLRDYADEVHRRLPFRDCSSAGIKKYFDHPPRDPVDTGTTTAVPQLPVPTTRKAP